MVRRRERYISERDQDQVKKIVGMYNIIVFVTNSRTLAFIRYSPI